jgi:hypothetical protein
MRFGLLLLTYHDGSGPSLHYGECCHQVLIANHEHFTCLLPHFKISLLHYYQEVVSLKVWFPASEEVLKYLSKALSCEVSFLTLFYF